MKHTILSLACAVSLSASVCAQVNQEAFTLLDLDYPGLEEVRKHYVQGDREEAAVALLDYYRHRTGIVNPFVDVEHPSISQREQQWADDALAHTFYVHDGYQPSFNYGEDIDWKYWPVKDNELRWQLHRHKWFTPMGKAYRLSGDERYAAEWAAQYMDWIRKNPLTPIDKEMYELTDTVGVTGNAENVRFAWRPLEATHRLQDQTNQFALFICSPSFTPAFLTEFLVNYNRHAMHVQANYSAEGNHLLFEAQRMLVAGVFFPEFKEAAAWRRSGIDILNREIKKQVYSDGGQYELDLHYHLAAIGIFCKALLMADANGFRNEFPDSYIDTVEKMIVFYMNLCFPDYSNPCFSDAKRGNPQTEKENYRQWSRLFPENRQIRYFATEGREGEAPANLSRGFLRSGFFAFRNGWKQDATVMVVKAGPKGEWHCQPDNGTFELWHNGKNLFPDSGSYIYDGEGEVAELRRWFRQTAVHNTLTLDNRNLEVTESVTRLWQPEGDVQLLVTENPGYGELTHRRSVFFVDGKFFVIVDEAIGNATGTVALHYQLRDGKVDISPRDLSLASDFEGKSQVKLQCFGDVRKDGGQTVRMEEEEGWYSVAYRQRTARTAVAFSTVKKDAAPVRFVTVIYPTDNRQDFPDIKARFTNKKKCRVEVTIDGKPYRLDY